MVASLKCLVFIKILRLVKKKTGINFSILQLQQWKDSQVLFFLLINKVSELKILFEHQAESNSQTWEFKRYVDQYPCLVVLLIILSSSSYSLWWEIWEEIVASVNPMSFDGGKAKAANK